MRRLSRIFGRVWLVALTVVAANAIGLEPLPRTGASLLSQPPPSTSPQMPRGSLGSALDPSAGESDRANRPDPLSVASPNPAGFGREAGAGSIGAPSDAQSTGPAEAGGGPAEAGGGPAEAGGGHAQVVDPAIIDGDVDRTSLDLQATYDAEVRLGYEARRLDVDVTIALTNTSGGPIDRVELNTVAAALGNLQLVGASVDGRPVTPVIDDQTLLVPLGGILPAAASARIRIAFRSTLRTGVSGSDWLFTRANGIVDAYRWLPWISRRTPFARPNHGDPFVTPASPRVTVRVTTDRPLVMATTGERIAVDGLTQTFEARDVRDFTLTAASDFRVDTATAGDVTIRAFTRPGGPAAVTLLREARHALLAMGDRLGAYPYRSFAVVQSAGGYGMESPGLIWVPTGVVPANLRYLVHHETAHQWFYGIVGSDQAVEPFADEAAADFLARHVLDGRRASRCAAAPLDRSIYQYSAACYYETIYIQGGALLDGLRRRMGDDRFWQALRAYIDAHRFGRGGSETLLHTLDEGTPLDLASTFARAFPSLR